MGYLTRSKKISLHNTALVITPDWETTSFHIVAGVRKGDALAPFLFIVVLDYVLRLSLDNMNEKGLEIRSRRHLTKHLTDRDFADDLALITEAVLDAESLLSSLENAAALVGLYCNVRKLLSPYHHITTSPHHHITTSPHQHIHITTSPHHHITTSPHHHITTSPHHHIT